ncbi:MAG TPA: hypothetical protein VEY68_15655 [Anoxybacillus sp.]|nr:hypothetical protein [Anoxybacillus sp.]
MGKLLALFAVGAIGMTLRFIILGKFEWNQLFSLLLFPIGASGISLIKIWQIKRDSNYHPKETRDVWYTHMGERYSTGKKLLFKGNQKIGEFHRFYPHWWQHVVNEVIEGDGKWYMNLSFTLHNKTLIQFVQQKKKKIHFNETWHIIQNGEVIGTVRTDYSLKNATKLQEGLILEIHNQTFYFQSFGIGSHTKVLMNDEVIATGERSHTLHFQFQYEFAVKEGYAEIEPLLVMTYVLFNYVHNQ